MKDRPRRRSVSWRQRKKEGDGSFCWNWSDMRFGSHFGEGREMTHATRQRWVKTLIRIRVRRRAKSKVEEKKDTTSCTWDPSFESAVEKVKIVFGQVLLGHPLGSMNRRGHRLPNHEHVTSRITSGIPRTVYSTSLQTRSPGSSPKFRCDN